MVQFNCIHDHQLVVHLEKNPIFHARAKQHVKGHYHFIKEKVLNGEIKIKQIKTLEQVANMLTKGSSGTIFLKLQD